MQADRRIEETLKRLMDLVGSGVGLTLLGPGMLAIGAAIRATMGKPVLFRQKRPGRYGVPFELLKFRTMRHARPGEDGPEFDADRTTRLGRFLRAASLDELPTFINVLKGEMSLVGPRPLLMEYLDRYTPEQARRHDVRPGITGWAQINGRNALSWEEKFEMDVWYVDHWSLWLDIKILFLTIWKVVRREGIDHGAGMTMPLFLGTAGHRGTQGMQAPAGVSDGT